jgi:DNA repair protein RecO (recombination protein O)
MAIVGDRCICLRKTEYSETSQILTLLGREHGLFRAIAKGAHRRTKAGASRFDGGADLLDVGDAMVVLDVARDLSTLTEWKLRDGHLPLRNNLRGMYLAIYAAELTSSLLEEHDPHPELFDRLEAVFSDVATPKAEEAFLAFELDLLRQTGHLPQLASCAQCNGSLDDRDGVYFSPARGGAICRNCQATTPDRLSIDARLLRLAQQMLSLPRSNGSPQRLPRLTRHQTDPLNWLLANHVEYFTGKRLSMPRYVVGKT